jgi:hypothetical protein
MAGPLPSWNDTPTRAAIVAFVEQVCDESSPGFVAADERVVGSSNALGYREDDDGGSVVYHAQPDVFDDGPAKPVQIWSRIGRRPILACGNSNGDVPMLRFASHPSRPSLALLVRHDDGDREFADDSGADRALKHAGELGWSVISMRDDWSRVFDT